MQDLTQIISSLNPTLAIEIAKNPWLIWVLMTQIILNLP
jgi:hypothetical protein